MSLPLRFVFALAAVALALACSTPTRGTGGMRLVVASDIANPPFAYLDGDGRPAGRDVEMMQALAELVGRELEWRRMPFEELLDAVAAGEVDVVCATLGITDERRRRVDFSRPYFVTSIAVVARSGDGEPASLADLAGRRVTGGAGTTSEKAVRERLPDAIGVFGGKSSQEALLAGEVDAAAMDGPAAQALVDGSQGALVLFDEPLAQERYALAFPKGSELGATIDAALRVMVERGELAELDRRHRL